MPACHTAFRPAVRLSSKLTGNASGFPACLLACRAACRLSAKVSGWPSDIPATLQAIHLTCLFAGELSSTNSVLPAGFQAFCQVCQQACLPANKRHSLFPCREAARDGAGRNDGMLLGGQIWTMRGRFRLRHPRGRSRRNPASWTIVTPLGTRRRVRPSRDLESHFRQLRETAGRRPEIHRIGRDLNHELWKTHLVQGERLAVRCLGTLAFRGCRLANKMSNEPPRGR